MELGFFSSLQQTAPPPRDATNERYSSVFTFSRAAPPKKCSAEGDNGPIYDLFEASRHLLSRREAARKTETKATHTRTPHGGSTRSSSVRAHS